ncbi:MAG: fluoride efflux transporter CrcB [Gemmatimonadaceae bacterium]|nr:fluoride efflux transporter CrcB [Gemmatimonadaceae bacterium]
MLWGIAIGGAAGSVSRYALSMWLTRAHGHFPLGTFVINISGSFLIALFARVYSTPDSNPIMRAALTIGFCGGFTTFSTFSAEFVTLMQEGRTSRAVLYALASVLTGVLAVVAGLAVGNRLVTPRG